MEFNVRRALRPGRSFFSGMWTLLAGIAVLACSAGSGSFAMDGGIDDAQAVDDGAIDGAIPDSPFQSGGDSAGPSSTDAGLCIVDGDIRDSLCRVVAQHLFSVLVPLRHE